MDSIIANKVSSLLVSLRGKTIKSFKLVAVIMYIKPRSVVYLFIVILSCLD